MAARWNCVCGICKIRSVVNSLIAGGCRTYVPERVPMFRNVRKHCFPAAGLASVNFVPAFPAYYRYKARYRIPDFRAYVYFS